MQNPMMPVFVDGKRVASQSGARAEIGDVLFGIELPRVLTERADVGGAVADGPVEARVQVGRDRAETGGRKAPDDVAYRRIDAPYVHDDDDRRRCCVGLFRPSGIRRHGRAVDVEDGTVDSDARVALRERAARGSAPSPGADCASPRATLPMPAVAAAAIPTNDRRPTSSEVARVGSTSKPSMKEPFDLPGEGS